MCCVCTCTQATCDGSTIDHVFMSENESADQNIKSIDQLHAFQKFRQVPAEKSNDVACSWSKLSALHVCVCALCI